jgi:Flp pilus assembly protein CpaB
VRIFRKGPSLDVEGDFHDPNSHSRRVMMALGLIMAGLTGLVVFVQASGNAQGNPAVTRTVVVAASQISAGTSITGSQLALKAMVDSPYLASAMVDPGLVVGKVAGVVIYAGQPILPNLLSRTVAGAAFSILNPNETTSPDSPIWRAVSIAVPRDRAVGGQVEVGQRVDLLATIQIKIVNANGSGSQAASSPGYYSDDATKVTLTNLEVLAQDAENDIYILKVDLHQAEEIAQIEEVGGSFTMSLRPDGDDRLVDGDGYGQTTNQIIEKYHFPLPQIIPLDTYQQPSPGVDVTPAPSTPTPTPAPTPEPSASPAPGESLSPSSSGDVPTPTAGASQAP